MRLTRTQSATLRQLIDARADEILERVRNTLPKPVDESTLERTSVMQDEVDDATISAEEHINHVMHQHYIGELRQIDAARERVEMGLIHCCMDCGGDINFERLRATPFAVRCVDCQERHEYKVKANSR
jgi:RNA polymerase-binding transcription factor DksA